MPFGQELKGRLLKGSFDKACAFTCRFLCRSPPQPPTLPTPFPFSLPTTHLNPTLNPSPRDSNRNCHPFAKTTPGKSYPFVSARTFAKPLSFLPEPLQNPEVTSRKACLRNAESYMACSLLVGIRDVHFDPTCRRDACNTFIGEHRLRTTHPQKASDLKVVFSPGVLRSKDFFDPIFVVLSDYG